MPIARATSSNAAWVLDAPTWQSREPEWPNHAVLSLVGRADQRAIRRSLPRVPHEPATPC